MEFLIDENLPPSLAEWIRQSGFTARHINEFANEHPISDNAIRRYLLKHPSWILVTRDDDFVKSYVSRKVPERIIYAYNFENRAQIMESFQKYWTEIVRLIDTSELIEVNPSELKVHY